MTNKKIYVGNLPFSAEENQLKALFEGDGRQVLSVKIMTDRETGRSRGFAFIEMVTVEDATKAMTALQGQDFMGRPLALSEARAQAPRAPGGFGGGGGGFGGGGGGGFNRDRGPRPSGFGSGGGGGFGGGGYSAPTDPNAPPEGGNERGRADRNRGRDRDKSRRERGGRGDW